MDVGLRRPEAWHSREQCSLFFSVLYFYPQSRWSSCLSQEIAEWAFLLRFSGQLLGRNVSLSQTQTKWNHDPKTGIS